MSKTATVEVEHPYTAAHCQEVAAAVQGCQVHYDRSESTLDLQETNPRSTEHTHGDNGSAELSSSVDEREHGNNRVPAWCRQAPGTARKERGVPFFVLRNNRNFNVLQRTSLARLSAGHRVSPDICSIYLGETRFSNFSRHISTNLHRCFNQCEPQTAGLAQGLDSIILMLDFKEVKHLAGKGWYLGWNGIPQVVEWAELSQHGGWGQWSCHSSSIVDL